MGFRDCDLVESISLGEPQKGKVTSWSLPLKVQSLDCGAHEHLLAIQPKFEKRWASEVVLRLRGR